MTDALKALAEDYNPKHSAFQINHFMIGKEPTKYGAYKQALREFFSRYFTLRKMMEQDAEADWQAQHDMIEIHHLKREMVHVFLIANALHEELHADSYDEARLNEEYWDARIRGEIAKDLIAHRTILRQTLETVMMLPRRRRQALLDILQTEDGRQSIIHDYENGPFELPEITQEQIDSHMEQVGSLVQKVQNAIASS